MDKENRIVVLIDMDCFYCQVEEKLNPELKGKPIAVVQYNPWKGGGIIAVNYVARARGVTRHMRGNEAKEKCPEIQLPSVPCQRGKADITKYRDAGKEVARVLQRFTPLMERASIDEAYLDITASVQERLQTINVNTVTSEMTPNCFALGYNSMADFVSDVHGCGDDIDFDYDHATRLLVGALVVSEIRAAVYNETGIAHNKILAKLVCGMNKPDKQTVLPKHSINTLYQTLPVKKVKHLGGKFGDTVCEVLRIKNMAELQQFSEKDLQNKFDEKNGSWLYNISRGIDSEPVQARYNPKSIGCCKQFRGKSALLDLHSLQRWLKDLGEEIEDRLEKDALENSRSPRQMVVSYSVQVGRDVSSSRSYNFAPDDDLCGELFSSKALELILDGMEGSKYNDSESNRRLQNPIKFLGISVGKFEDHSESKKTKKIKDYFAAGLSKVECDPRSKNEGSTQLQKIVLSTSGKDHIMQKFLRNGSPKELKDDKNSSSDSIHRPRLESLLDKQESFFAKFLNRENDDHSNQMPTTSTDENNTSPIEGAEIIEEGKVEKGGESCKDDSNDTYCSGSTIDEEINKSIALFEEDADGVDRVTKMRLLLSSTGKENEINDEGTAEEQAEEQNSKHESIECSECGKTIAMDMLDVHSDYHLALKLRDEYRQEARNELKEKSVLKELADKDVKNNRKTIENVSHKAQSISSIRSFLTKVDSTVPSKICSECGRRIANDKFMEHLDYHEAKKLSRQINNKIVHVASNSSTSNASSVKRKRKSESPTKKPKVPCKSINLFFKS